MFVFSSILLPSFWDNVPTFFGFSTGSATWDAFSGFLEVPETELTSVRLIRIRHPSNVVG